MYFFFTPVFIIYKNIYRHRFIPFVGDYYCVFIRYILNRSNSEVRNAPVKKPFLPEPVEIFPVPFIHTIEKIIWHWMLTVPLFYIMMQRLYKKRITEIIFYKQITHAWFR